METEYVGQIKILTHAINISAFSTSAALALLELTSRMIQTLQVFNILTMETNSTG